jgi:uncharacterized protein (TIGR02147 family)
LNLTKQEDEYFEYLTSFLHATSPNEKSLHFNKILECQTQYNTRKISDAQFKYYSNWYTPVIRELITDFSFDGNLQQLGLKVIPPLAIGQISESIEILLQLGFIEKKGNRYFQKDKCVFSGDLISSKTESAIIRKFHLAMASQGVGFYNHNKKDKHNFTSVTVALSDPQYENLIQELSFFRKKVISLAADTDKATRVFHLNLQLFPLSK